MKEFIEEVYGIKIEGLQPHGNGQTSDIYKIISDSGSYILKSHLNEQTATNEFYCLETLSKVNLSARPLYTVNNSIYFKHVMICKLILKRKSLYKFSGTKSQIQISVSFHLPGNQCWINSKWHI